MKKVYSIMTTAALVGLTSSVGLADSISPASYEATLGLGDSVTITKTVTVSEGVPTSSKVDVYFLADVTGSMGGAIANVKASAASILSETAGLGDVQFGVGQYAGESGANSYRLLQGMTSNAGAAQSAINSWSASGGGDTPEANLYGLHQAASEGATGWRTGSEKILVWFGDAPGHDPSPGGSTPPGGKVNEAQTISALQATGINVQALNVGFGGLDSTGQATRITNATGGDLYNGIATDEVADAIKDAIAMVIANYNTVGLDLSEVPAGVTVTSVPGSTSGDFDRSEERSFEFDVTFTGDAEGVYDFNIYGTVDGGRVATESDRITVGGGGGGGGGGGTSVPDGGHAVALFGLALLATGAARKKFCR